MACEMSDYAWEMWENEQYSVASGSEPENIIKARAILSGNEGWFTEEEIAWALKQYPDD